ncbi:MAG: hypothetical protein Q7T97_12850, partial [Burkholderiaceae bacterium]|nr:hypothetical protein [Burkholderiaceae bacterium]
VRQIENELNAGINLLRTVKSEEKLWQFRSKKLIERQSRTLFSAAYYLRDKAWLSGMQALWKSFFLSPSIKHLKLALKYFLPMYLLKKKSCEDIQS